MPMGLQADSGIRKTFIQPYELGALGPAAHIVLDKAFGLTQGLHDYSREGEEGSTIFLHVVKAPGTSTYQIKTETYGKKKFSCKEIRYRFRVMEYVRGGSHTRNLFVDGSGGVSVSAIENVGFGNLRSETRSDEYEAVPRKLEGDKNADQRLWLYKSVDELEKAARSHGKFDKEL